MSKREDIVADVVTQLKTIVSPRLGRVVREPIVVEELSRQALPAIYVESTDEAREDRTMGGGKISTMTVVLNMLLQSDTRDKDRNTLIEAIEEKLETTRRRDGKALDTYLEAVEIVETGEAVPYASMRMIFGVQYVYQRGTA